MVTRGVREDYPKLYGPPRIATVEVLIRADNNLVYKLVGQGELTLAEVTPPRVTPMRVANDEAEIYDPFSGARLAYLEVLTRVEVLTHVKRQQAGRVMGILADGKYAGCFVPLDRLEEITTKPLAPLHEDGDGEITAQGR
ncbi:MAG: hypothetical protein K8L91_01555 [Anaerolineae bacterium]|nr:hypothetical protein [Anaerolineae bacterium]